MLYSFIYNALKLFILFLVPPTFQDFKYTVKCYVIILWFEFYVAINSLYLRSFIIFQENTPIKAIEIAVNRKYSFHQIRF